MTRILADTGPLVALLDTSDHAHPWALDCFKRLHGSLLTCEAVLSETCHLLRRAGPALASFLAMCRSGLFETPIRFDSERDSILDLLESYRNTPMDFADACLVRLSETHEPCLVWTLDTDFKHYRRHKRRTIPLLAPWT